MGNPAGALLDTGMTVARNEFERCENQPGRIREERVFSTMYLVYASLTHKKQAVTEPHRDFVKTFVVLFFSVISTPTVRRTRTGEEKIHSSTSMPGTPFLAAESAQGRFLPRACQANALFHRLSPS